MLLVCPLAGKLLDDFHLHAHSKDLATRWWFCSLPIEKGTQSLSFQGKLSLHCDHQCHFSCLNVPAIPSAAGWDNCLAVCFQSQTAALQDTEDGLGSEGHAGYPSRNIHLRVRRGCQKRDDQIHFSFFFFFYSMKYWREAALWALSLPNASTGMSVRSSLTLRPTKGRMTLSSSPSTTRWLNFVM